MLNANKGIPVWRHPQCAQLVVTTGLVEGLALLLLATAGAPRHLQIALLLAALAAWRALAWRRFRAALARDGAPAAALDALRSIDSGFFWGGNAAPALLAVASVALSLPALAVIAGLAAAAGGAWLKYTLVCRAAYTQGFALPTLAVRGQGAAAPGVKPGWAQPARTG
jgi:phenylacetyl-CoA:acceptor oxidoreductase subunit 2